MRSLSRPGTNDLTTTGIKLSVMRSGLGQEKSSLRIPNRSVKPLSLYCLLRAREQNKHRKRMKNNPLRMSLPTWLRSGGRDMRSNADKIRFETKFEKRSPSECWEWRGWYFTSG